MSSYIPVLLLMIVSAGLAVVMLVLATFVGPKRTNPEKEMPFETGNLPVDTVEKRWRHLSVKEFDPKRFNWLPERFPIHYYLVAILFVVFDVEIAFLYPWAVQFKLLGWFGFIEMLIFVGVLFVGWYYVIKRGVLGWR